MRKYSDPGDDYLNKVIKYIPAEIQAFYVFAAGLIASDEPENQFAIFQWVAIALMIITPLWVYFTLPKHTNPTEFKLRIFSAVVAVISLIIWIYNININWTIELFKWLPNSTIVASIALAFWTLVAPLLERIIVGTTKPNLKP